MKRVRRNIAIRRDLLLVEIERRCQDAQCGARARIGLTKEEARAYRGFECERCERWHDDALTERDIPDWWEELAITALEGIRPKPAEVADETGEVIMRLSDAWRRARAHTGDRDEGEGDQS